MLSTDQDVGSKKSSNVGPQLVNGHRIPPVTPLTMDWKDLPIKELLEYCLRTKDPAAWSEFIRRIDPITKGAIVKRLRLWIQPTPDLVDDLAQDTRAKLFANDARALRNLHCAHENAVFGFVKVVAANVAEDYRRSRSGKMRAKEESLEIIEQKSATGSKEKDLNILREQIDKCLLGLAGGPAFARDRAIFWLYYRWGYTAKQIARLPSINLPIKDVENLLLRLVRLVKSKLKQGPGPEDSADE
jgi:RNA polymerase sigma-70 factor (ECF subfamily)